MKEILLHWILRPSRISYTGRSQVPDALRANVDTDPTWTRWSDRNGRTRIDQPKSQSISNCTLLSQPSDYYLRILKEDVWMEGAAMLGTATTSEKGFIAAVHSTAPYLCTVLRPSVGQRLVNAARLSLFSHHSIFGFVHRRHQSRARVDLRAVDADSIVTLKKKTSGWELSLFVMISILCTCILTRKSH